MIQVAEFCLRPFTLPLRTPLATAHGTIRAREGWIVLLRDASGEVGYGEAAPLPGFGLESREEAEAALRAVGAELCKFGRRSLMTNLDHVDAMAKDRPCARGALDTALHDLASRLQGVPLSALLADRGRRRPRARVGVAALLSATGPSDLGEEAAAAVAAGFPALKLKVGLGNADLERVAAVRRVCPDAVELRLDANGAWEEADARERLAALAPYRPAWVEQPVADVEALARLRETSPVPLGADECLSNHASAGRIAERQAADVWVLKPAVLGGLRATQAMAELARASDALPVIGGFLDSAVGTWAAVSLAAALAKGPPSGLGPVLAADLGAPPRLETGHFHVPTERRAVHVHLAWAPDAPIEAIPCP
ncbi:MAG: o-succinylbenzoate synthase [Myxococcota bacterium]